MSEDTVRQNLSNDLRSPPLDGPATINMSSLDKDDKGNFLLSPDQAELFLRQQERFQQHRDDAASASTASATPAATPSQLALSLDLRQPPAQITKSDMQSDAFVTSVRNVNAYLRQHDFGDRWWKFLAPGVSDLITDCFVTARVENATMWEAWSAEKFCDEWNAMCSDAQHSKATFEEDLYIALYKHVHLLATLPVTRFPFIMCDLKDALKSVVSYHGAQSANAHAIKEITHRTLVPALKALLKGSGWRQAIADAVGKQHAENRIDTIDNFYIHMQQGAGDARASFHTFIESSPLLDKARNAKAVHSLPAPTMAISELQDWATNKKPTAPKAEQVSAISRDTSKKSDRASSFLLLRRKSSWPSLAHAVVATTTGQRIVGSLSTATQ